MQVLNCSIWSFPIIFEVFKQFQTIWIVWKQKWHVYFYKFLCFYIKMSSKSFNLCLGCSTSCKLFVLSCMSPLEMVVGPQLQLGISSLSSQLLDQPTRPTTLTYVGSVPNQKWHALIYATTTSVCWPPSVICYIIFIFSSLALFQNSKAMNLVQKIRAACCGFRWTYMPGIAILVLPNNHGGKTPTL